MTLPTPEQLQQAWICLKATHQRYLAKHNVKLPKAEHYSKRNKSLWLAVLFFYKDTEVHKDKISEIAQRDIGKDTARDQQVRHLKRDGWEIGPKDGIHKLDPYRVSSEFLNQVVRKKTLKSNDFNEIKIAFGNSCATCGAEEGKPDPRYGQTLVQLQQGHRDPGKAGDSRENIIPQCQFCNRSYQNDFVFDEKGRIHSVASIEPVRRASPMVQKKILSWLNEKFATKTE